MNLSASRGVDPLEDRGTSHLSLDGSPLSGPELSSTKSKARWTEQETKVAKEESSKLRIAFTRPIQVVE
ncbi:hypothetical protein F2Q69_00010415 [Brassica cretica]|uniref:Uncharacterized protein n=1 Tax=Brassica cretica TaxID=69181 RepID=A0A8S9QJ97_BRACR|nr:hypothetical protein F2Q69_00010415 [Brassica cretica]